jgi:hypothetical protein
LGDEGQEFWVLFLGLHVEVGLKFDNSLFDEIDIMVAEPPFRGEVFPSNPTIKFF